MSSSQTFNYIMKDPLLDYLDEYYSEGVLIDNMILHSENNSLFLQTLKNNGIDFEKLVIDCLFKKFPDNIMKLIVMY